MAIIKTKGYQFEPTKGFFGDPPIRKIYRYMIIDDKVEEVREVVVHEFTLGDVDDPDLYAAQPLYEWEKSEAGQWIMENAVESPCWYRIPDSMQYGYKYQVRAKLSGPRLTEFLLRKK
jgi:hypothetical protein